MTIILDHKAGPCPGVKRAIRMAEEELVTSGHLTAVGPLIHNQDEISRLSEKGLKTMDQDQLEQTDPPAGDQNDKLLIRSHGISRDFYDKLKNQNKTIIDGTCPKVAKIHKIIHEHYQNGYQIVIIGKPQHPEVKGLNGHCDNTAVVIQEAKDIEKIDFNKKTLLVAQTTFSHSKFYTLRDEIQKRHPHLIWKDTTCPQVRRRHQHMQEFAASVNVVVLVGGKQSSNTGVLYDISKMVNPRTHWIENQNDVQSQWFEKDDTVGITGSASTPKWQLQQIEHFLKKLPIEGL